MKKVLLFSISAIVALSMFSCMEKPTAETETEQATDSLEVIQPVKIMPLELQTIKRTVEVTATMVAQEETYLAPGIAGKIRSIQVDINDNVKKNQLLVQMDKTQLLQTRVQYEGLKKDLARLDTLLNYGSITQQAYDQMLTQVQVTRVMLKSLEENTELRAPYAGVITGKYFNSGELFSPAPNTPAGKAAIVSIVKMDVLKVYINLSERLLPLIKVGQIATIKTEVYPNELFEAKVYRIHPTINAATRTFTVELHLDNPDLKLRPGMYGTVTQEMGDRDALLVPSIAVLKQPGTNNRYVFLHEDGISKKMLVQIGERLDDKLELLSNGLKEGDELIFAGHVNLMEGDKVTVVSE